MTSSFIESVDREIAELEEKIRQLQKIRALYEPRAVKARAPASPGAQGTATVESRPGSTTPVQATKEQPTGPIPSPTKEQMMGSR